MIRGLTLRLSEEAQAYFDSCARIRDVMSGPLIVEVLETVARSQLVQAVLDDVKNDGQYERLVPVNGRKYVRRWRRTKASIKASKEN